MKGWNHSDTQIVRKPFFFGILATMKKLKKSFKEKCFFYDKNKARGCRRSYQKSFVFENFFFTHFQIPDLLSFRFFGPSGKVFIEVMIHPKIDEKILSHEKNIC